MKLLIVLGFCCVIALTAASIDDENESTVMAEEPDAKMEVMGSSDQDESEDQPFEDQKEMNKYNDDDDLEMAESKEDTEDAGMEKSPFWRRRRRHVVHVRRRRIYYYRRRYSYYYRRRYSYYYRHHHRRRFYG